jgi:hypothetical protein
VPNVHEPLIGKPFDAIPCIAKDKHASILETTHEREAAESHIGTNGVRGSVIDPSLIAFRRQTLIPADVASA